MAVNIQFELDDNDLERLREYFRRGREKAGGVERARLLQSARELIEQDLGAPLPAFVRERLEGLKKLVDMADDEAWGLPAEERDRIADTVAYFVERNDSIPDDTPVLGLLDDAIAAELVLKGLRHEIEAYDEFCEYRSAEIQRRQSRGEPADVSKKDWLADRRAVLHSRMFERRGADAAGWHTSLFGWSLNR
jgi:uncharacterized membrane protein YkvA (DUF1232 family)